MNQSDRIRYIKEFNNHPLKKEYLKEKAKVTGEFYLVNQLEDVFVVLKYIYGFLFVLLFILYLFLTNDYTRTILHIMLIISILGIINLVLPLLLLIFVDIPLNFIKKKIHKGDLEKLKSEYMEKGLIEIDSSELYKHECCERDENFGIVCCITKKPISLKEYNYFCSIPGKCKHCRTFVEGYLGKDTVNYWNHEFER